MVVKRDHPLWVVDVFFKKKRKWHGCYSKKNDYSSYVKKYFDEVLVAQASQHSLFQISTANIGEAGFRLEIRCRGEY